MEQKAIQFLNRKRETLCGVLTLPKTKGKAPLVIMCPGFGQTKSQRKFVELGRALAKNEIASFRFDFSGQGDSQGDFAKLSIKNQVEDLKSAFDVVAKNPKITKNEIAILGHSLGTLIAVLFQAKYKKAKSLILLSSALHQKELVKEWYAPEQLALWQKQGYLDTAKGRLGPAYLKEAFSRNWSEVISQVDVPVLFIHGKEDEDVPLKYAKDLFEKLGGKKKLEVVKDVDHHFEGFEAKRALNKLVLAWLRGCGNPTFFRIGRSGKMKKAGVTYVDAGVNIQAAGEAVEGIKHLVAATRQPWVLADIGPFSGLIDLGWVMERYKHPVLVQSTDGVGTKMLIAEAMGRLDIVGGDVVCHCANDLLTVGPVEPLSFLDYIGTDRLSPVAIKQIMAGMAKACCELGCPIIGGEMAEMPDVYQKERHELVGQMTGVVEREKIIDGSKVTPGDQLIGLASDGLHTNGFSQARRVLFEERGFNVTSFANLGGKRTKLGEELLRPHRSYVGPILKVLAEGLEIRGIAHITGGGIAGNLVRILPEGCRAIVYKSRWLPPPIFSFIQGDGCVSDEEMFHTFNMGIGMIVVVPGWQAGRAAQRLEWYLSAQEGDKGLGAANKFAFQIGDIKQGEKGVEII